MHTASQSGVLLSSLHADSAVQTAIPAYENSVQPLAKQEAANTAQTTDNVAIASQDPNDVLRQRAHTAAGTGQDASSAAKSAENMRN